MPPPGHVLEAIVDELKRQSRESSGRLKVEMAGAETLRIEGLVNLEELVQAMLGAAAGGP